MDNEATMELFLGAQSSFLPIVNWFDSLCIEFQVQRMNEMKYSKMYEQNVPSMDDFLQTNIYEFRLNHRLLRN